MYASQKSFPAETFYNSFGKSWTRLVGATFGDAWAPWNGVYQREVDYSLWLAYSTTAAIGHHSLSSSDTTALELTAVFSSLSCATCNSRNTSCLWSAMCNAVLLSNYSRIMPYFIRLFPHYASSMKAGDYAGILAASLQGST